MDKPALFTAFRAHLAARLTELERSRDQATAGTRIDQDRPANRGERAAVSSQGYLALGLGQRIQALRDHLDLLDRIPAAPRDKVVTGALVTLVDEDDLSRVLLLLPGGEGLTLEQDGETVTVVSNDAPLVRPLLGKEAGDEARVQIGPRVLAVEVEDVA